MSEEFGLVGKILFGFAFYYPLFMAYHWMTGALYSFFHYEIKLGKVNSPPPLPMTPAVTILVPCHNDQGIIAETIGHLMQQNYPDFEVIAIHDGSRCGTGRHLAELAGPPPPVRRTPRSPH